LGVDHDDFAHNMESCVNRPGWFCLGHWQTLMPKLIIMIFYLIKIYKPAP
jgi:hypothetical protein